MLSGLSNFNFHVYAQPSPVFCDKSHTVESESCASAITMIVPKLRKFFGDRLGSSLPCPTSVLLQLEVIKCPTMGYDLAWCGGTSTHSEWYRRSDRRAISGRLSKDTHASHLRVGGWLMMREGSFVKLQCAELAGKLVALLGERKTKCACIVDSSESTRKRMEGSLHKSIYSYASSNKKYQMRKAAVDKEWEKLEKIPAWQLMKVRNKNEVIAEARNKGNIVHFALLMEFQSPNVHLYGCVFHNICR